MNLSSPLRHVLYLAMLALPDVGFAQEAIDVDLLVAEAMQKEPGLLRMRELVVAAGEVPSQVASLPDPVVMLGASNFRIDDPGLSTSPMSGVVFGVLQPVPYPLKLTRRKQLAQAVERLAESGVLREDAVVELEVRQRYWAYRYAEQSVRITAENVSVLEGLTNMITARFAVAQVAQQDVLQIQVAETSLRSTLVERRQAAKSRQRELNAAVGRPPAADLGPTKPPPDNVTLDRAALLKRIDARNPDVAIAAAKTSTARAAVAEARAGRAPDFAFGADYRVRGQTPGDMTQGANMVTGSVRVFLPVWTATKQTAKVREQRSRLLAAESGEADVLLKAQTQLQRTIDEMEQLDEQIELYTTQVVPQAEQALSASINDYSTARVVFVSVLQNWSVSLQAQLTLERLHMQHAQTHALIDALVGGIEGNP